MKPESGFGQILLLDSGYRRRGGPEARNVSDVGCAHPVCGIITEAVLLIEGDPVNES
jgi:hypothetical protein